MIWGERLGRGPDGPAALSSLLEITDSLDCSADSGGVFSVPDGSNARGVREVGCLPGSGPGFAPAAPGLTLDLIKQGLTDGSLDGVILLHADPVRDLPDGPAWAKALNNARTVVSISSFDDASTKAARHRPPRRGVRREGGHRHPPRRSPPAPAPRRPPPRPGPPDLAGPGRALRGSRPRDGHRLRVRGAASDRRRGPVLRRPDARGDRRHRHPLANPPGVRRLPGRRRGENVRRSPSSADSGTLGTNGLRLGTYRDLWADETTERNVALRFLVPEQNVEIAPADAERLGLANGDEVNVRSNGTSVQARVKLKERIRPGAAFLIEGTSADSANLLAGAETVEIEKR